MAMTLPNTASTNIVDDIINGADEAKYDYKSSVEFEADGGVISPHELVINPKNSLKEVVSQLVKVSGVSIDDFDITVDEMTESFEYSDHNWKGLSLQSKCDAIHYIFSMPVFHGKFDHLLELICSKEQTTSTSSTSTTSGCPALPGGAGSGSGIAANYQCTQGSDSDCFDCKFYYCHFHRLNHLLFYMSLTQIVLYHIHHPIMTNRCGRCWMRRQ